MRERREDELSTNSRLPQARRDGLIVRELPDEVLVYDNEDNKAHCLNQTAAAVWRHCDGETSVSEISFRLAREFSTPVDEDVVWLALDTLGKSGLLEEPMVRPTGVSRGAVVKKAALVGAALSVPAVFSVLAPTAGAAICSQACGGGITCTGSCPTCTGGTCQP